jgi:hypothetical protein
VRRVASDSVAVRELDCAVDRISLHSKTFAVALLQDLVDVLVEVSCGFSKSDCSTHLIQKHWLQWAAFAEHPTLKCVSGQIELERRMIGNRIRIV